MSKVVVNIGKETYSLSFEQFDDDIQLDDLLKIDYSNLIGEMVTFPVVLNKFGLLLADAESAVSEAKLTLDVFEAKTKEKLRVTLAEQNGGKAPTVDALNNAMVSSPAYQTIKKKYFETVKTRDYLNSVFWAMKAKDEKLNKLSLTIQPGDLSESLVEGKVNKVLVKKGKKLIQ